MIFDIGVYRLDIDVIRTRAYYEAHYGSELGCECDGCCNFKKAAYTLPEEILRFFQQFGADIGNPAEISAISSEDGSKLFYNGFYHICGTILEGTEPWGRVSEKHFNLDERYAVKLPGVFSVFFTSDCHLLDEDFPRPAIQMEITGSLPWVLDKPNPYIY